MSHNADTSGTISPIQDGTFRAAQDSDSTAVELGLASMEKAELEAENLLVDWDGPDDVASPVNWPARSRWAHIIMISILGLVTYAHPLPSSQRITLRSN